MLGPWWNWMLGPHWNWMLGPRWNCSLGPMFEMVARAVSVELDARTPWWEWSLGGSDEIECYGFPLELVARGPVKLYDRPPEGLSDMP